MIKTIFKRLMALVLCGLMTGPQGVVVWAAAPAAPKPVSLVGLEVASDQVTIKLSAVAQYNSFLTATPPRLVLELLNTEYVTGAKVMEGKGRFLKRVRSGQFERSPRMVARIVIDLKEVSAYRVVEQPKGLLVQLLSADDAASAAVPVPAAAPIAVPVAKPAAPVTVAASVPVAPAPSAEPVPVAVASVRPRIAPKPAAAHPAATPGSLSTESSEELLDAAAPDPEKAGVTEPVPVSRPQPMSKGDLVSRLTKDPVTLDFDNMDVRDIIKLLAAKAKINIIYGNDVSGTLTLHLTDVPFSEAFRTILSMMSLTTIQVGENILRILTPAELTKSRGTSTAVTRVITLNYSKAAELLGAVNGVRSAEGRSGSASADVKTNSLIVTESLEGLAATERLIAQLDVRPKQVLIEAKLIEVGLTNSLHYGIQWDYFSIDNGKSLGKKGATTVGGTMSPALETISPGVVGPLDRQVNTIKPGGTGVFLPSTAIFGALTLGRITNNYFLNASLTAAAAQGKVKVLSDPKIATLNNQPATINVTTSIPYVTTTVTSSAATETVTYVITGIKLAVTPSINADGRITLDINPDVSQPSATTASSTTGAPSIDSRNAKTTVLVKDGETIVIGGLISDSVSNQVAKIPILGDIPILGWLFRKKSVVRSRSELLIFVTPKIMPD